MCEYERRKIRFIVILFVYERHKKNQTKFDLKQKNATKHCIHINTDIKTKTCKLTPTKTEDEIQQLERCIQTLVKIVFISQSVDYFSHLTCALVWNLERLTKFVA